MEKFSNLDGESFKCDFQHFAFGNMATQFNIKHTICHDLQVFMYLVPRAFPMAWGLAGKFLPSQGKCPGNEVGTLHLSWRSDVSGSTAGLKPWLQAITPLAQ